MNGKYKLKNVSVLSLLVFVFFTAPLRANINVKAGPILSKFDIDDYYGYQGTPPKSLPGFCAGVSYSIRFLKNSHLEPGITFTNEAVRYWESTLKDYTDLRVNLLKVNLLLNLCMSPSRFHLTAGPYIVFRVGKEKNGSIGVERFSAEKKPGFGMLLGLRFYFRKSYGEHSGLFLEVLGDIGLTNFFNGDSAYFASYYRSKNISLLLGYSF